MTETGRRWLLRQLPREREPTRDLWQGIAAAIDRPRAAVAPTVRQRTRGAWQLFGSALAATVVLGAFAAGLAQPRLLERVGLRRAAPEHQLVLREAAEMRQHYQAELRKLRNKPVPADVTRSLIELDQSADNILVVLNAHPDAVFLLDQLHRTYARRLELTRRVAMY